MVVVATHCRVRFEFGKPWGGDPISLIKSLAFISDEFCIYRNCKCLCKVCCFGWVRLRVALAKVGDTIIVVSDPSDVGRECSEFV